MAKHEMNPRVDFCFNKDKWQKELQQLRMIVLDTPKLSKTRESRIEKCTQQILDGKGLNDDYIQMKKETPERRPCKHL